MRSLAALLLLSSVAFAAEPERFSLGGMATIRAPADYAVLTFRHMVIDPASSAKALEGCRKVVARAQDALRGEKVGKNEVNMLGLSLQTLLEHERSQTPKVLGFHASQTFQAVVRDLSRVPDVLQAVLDAGVLEVVATEYRTSKAKQLREQARKAALDDALEKARFMEHALGKKLRLVSIENIQLAFSDRPWEEARHSSSRIGIEIQQGELASWDSESPGTIRVTATAQAVFVGG